MGWCKDSDRGLPAPDKILFLDISVEDAMKVRFNPLLRNIHACFGCRSDVLWERRIIVPPKCCSTYHTRSIGGLIAHLNEGRGSRVL